jgi:hypothetical protein
MGIITSGVRLAGYAARASQNQPTASQKPKPAPAPTSREITAARATGVQILSETREFLAQHLAATPAQLDALTLYAAATHAIGECVTFGRLLIASEKPSSGKTLAMLITARLSANMLDTTGSSYDLNSALAAAHNEPEKAVPTLYRDEIGDVFSKSGLSGSSSPLADILRKGYKRGATRGWSVNRSPERYSIFTPFIMTGLGTAVPADIRSRCIIVTLESGTPEKYYDAREAEPYANDLAESLSKTVKALIGDVAAFRGRGIHPAIKNRALEVWEPILAVAWALGGQAWLNRAVGAFMALALDESDTVPLTPKQAILRDIAAIAVASDMPFVGGLHLADELTRFGSPIYTGRSAASLACLIRDTVPFASEQRRIDGAAVRGYPADALITAWEEVAPAEAADVGIPEEVNPFDVDEDEDCGETTRDTRDTRDNADVEGDAASDTRDSDDVAVTVAEISVAVDSCGVSHLLSGDKSTANGNHKRRTE